jgi:hypothetical protein
MHPILLEACRHNADDPVYQWFQQCPSWEKTREEAKRMLGPGWSENEQCLGDVTGLVAGCVIACTSL